MPGWLQAFANHQPLTYMVDAVRSLTLGSHAQALLGHPSSYYITRALIWALAILVDLATARRRQIPARLTQTRPHRAKGAPP